MSSTVTVTKMSNFDMDMGWTPEPDSPITVKEMSWRLGMDVIELVHALGVERFDLSAFANGGYREYTASKMHLSSNKRCPIARVPSKYPKAASRVIVSAAFASVPLEKRCESCNQAFDEE
jgi:hypothetical protein